MIARYETKEMKEIWSLENQYRSWEIVELAVCHAWAKDGVIPPEAMKKIDEKSGFDADEILRIEAEVKHDMIAFDTNMADHVGPEGRYIHLGLTSSDVEDTASALRLKQSLEIIISELDIFMKDVMAQAQKYKYTPSVARSHGVHAEPITFGLKILNWYSELMRDRRRLELALEEISYGKISGAVGTYAHCPPHIEASVCEELGLKPDPVSTQIIQRDRHSVVMFALASLGEAMERIATEIRHLQRTEVREALEPFGKKQKGSSAMPHKRNPIQCEKICGMARML
ncbi:MAG: adenylosuccinate lyase, partial [Synergistaceae bacterium]|nr:adenylosuccinate lyase [Synergistaceae bacterium]